MGNPYLLYVNRPVSYLDNTRPSGSPRARWTAARIVSITDANNVVLARVDGSQINSGNAVARYAGFGATTNVWRPY